MYVDGDGVYWVAGGPGIRASYLDGTREVTIAPQGQSFLKQGNSLYWFTNQNQTFYRRTIEHR